MQKNQVGGEHIVCLIGKQRKDCYKIQDKTVSCQWIDSPQMNSTSYSSAVRPQLDVQQILIRHGVGRGHIIDKKTF